MIKDTIKNNAGGLALLLAGTMADITTTCLVTDNSYGEEINKIPKYFMSQFGTENGQLALKLIFLSLYTLASAKLGPVLDRIFKTKDSTEKILYLGGYTQLATSGINLLSYYGINI